MITISRSLARRRRVVFSRGLGITARHAGPAVSFQSDDQGLLVHTQSEQIAIEYHEPGERLDCVFAMPFELLRRCEGTKHDLVALSPGGQSVNAAWTDASSPQTAQFDAAVREPEPLRGW